MPGATGRIEKKKKRKKLNSKDSLSILYIHISHNVHALRKLLTKLITGFSWGTKHYVGEKPKSEENC